ncbi:MAG: hypothetical protein KatS3mg003_0933 [Candidatus Nitrosocaldaceae archaeon]|nr:MAG: hypothetical protein KatS3mg003_0933 [Candidatus Nitrosocaldaceae archaeon]
MKQKRDVLAFKCKSCNALFKDESLAMFHHDAMVYLTLKEMSDKLDKYYHTIKPLKNIKEQDDDLPKWAMYNYRGVKDKIYCIICNCYIYSFKSRYSFRKCLKMHDLLSHDWIPTSLRGVIDEHKD